MKLSRIIVAGTLTAASVAATAQGLQNATPTLKTGNWTVLRNVDGMNDKIICTGIYKDNYRVQLTKEALYVRIPGGLEGIVLRFGDDPARPLRLPLKLEKEVGAVIFELGDFHAALATPRLRVQVGTLVRGVHFDDLDMTGAREAHAHITDGCPPAAGGASVARPSSESRSLCSAVLIQRMQAAGLSAQQVGDICRP